jgi:predicted transcriptional regulator
MNTMLISLKPRHCKNVFSGRKTMELRKRSPKKYSTSDGRVYPEFTHIIIYQSVRHEIIGMVECGEIITRYKDEWSADEIESLCISKDEIVAYTGDRKGVGIRIFNPRLFNTPIPIGVMINDFGIHPPQQFKYLNSDLSKKLINFGQTDTARNVARI